MPRAVPGLDPNHPASLGKENQRLMLLGGVFQSSPSLRRPIFLAPTRGSYIYEAQHL